MSMNKWERLGLLFSPEDSKLFTDQYVSMPMSYQLPSDEIRIYFSSRNKRNRSSVYYFEIDMLDPTVIRNLSKSPVFTHGLDGHFDDNGVYSGPLVEKEGKLYMFYSGRSNGEDYLFYMNVGLAVSEDNGLTFERYSQVPILKRSEYDPWLVTAPCVFQVGDKWQMIYTSGTKIFKNRTSNYDLKLAQSDDFFHWQQTGDVMIPLGEGESNISTPTIFEWNGNYHLWFSVKPKIGEYRIGYASSTDGLHWERDDQKLGLKTSQSGFDSEALSYPSMFRHEEYLYIVYSGNKNGRDGCGLARLPVREL